MGVLAEVHVTVEACVADLSAAGPAIVVWEAVQRRDQRLGSMIMATSDPTDLVASAACLLIHLLDRAGHHHRYAHTEVRDGSLPEHAAPFTEPHLTRDCPTGDFAADPNGGRVCDCSVETAARILAPVVEGTGAEHALVQVADAYAADRARTRLLWHQVNIAEATVLIQAAALLVTHYRGTSGEALLDDVRSRVVLDAAA